MSGVETEDLEERYSVGVLRAYALLMSRVALLAKDPQRCFLRSGDEEGEHVVSCKTFYTCHRNFNSKGMIQSSTSKVILY